MRDALRRFACELTTVRFLRLGPGSRIFEHRDYGLEFAGGEARLHVCVRTNERVRFLFDGRPVVMAEGDCWYLDVSRPHSVVNLGDAPRTHLVVDCVLNPWLRELLTATDVRLEASDA